MQASILTLPNSTAARETLNYLQKYFRFATAPTAILPIVRALVCSTKLNVALRPVWADKQQGLRR